MRRGAAGRGQTDPRGDLQGVFALLRSSGAVARVEREVCRLCAASLKAAQKSALRRVRAELEAVVAKVAVCP